MFWLHRNLARHCTSHVAAVIRNETGQKELKRLLTSQVFRKKVVLDNVTRLIRNIDFCVNKFHELKTKNLKLKTLLSRDF